MSNATLQAPAGGELHQFSDKFYLGGQFMPEPDALGGAKSKAKKALAKVSNFHSPSIGTSINGKLPISVTMHGCQRAKIVAWAQSGDESFAMLNIFRRAIEVRLGGGAIDWDSE